MQWREKQNGYIEQFVWCKAKIKIIYNKLKYFGIIPWREVAIETRCAWIQENSLEMSTLYALVVVVICVLGCCHLNTVVNMCSKHFISCIKVVSFLWCNSVIRDVLILGQV